MGGTPPQKGGGTPGKTQLLLGFCQTPLLWLRPPEESPEHPSNAWIAHESRQSIKLEDLINEIY